MKSFAVLQLSGCAGCEVSLLNASDWIDKVKLSYMPLVITTHTMPDVDVLLISGSVQSNEDLYNLRKSVRKARRLSQWVFAPSPRTGPFGRPDDIRSLFLTQHERRHVRACFQVAPGGRHH